MARLIDRLRTRSVPFASYEVTESTPWASSMWSWMPGRSADEVESVQAEFASFAGAGYSGNGIVHACVNARLRLFAQAELKFQNLSDKRLFGTPDLLPLEAPWPNGTTAELLARMLQDVDLGGNAFVVNFGERMVRLRPDYVDIVSSEVEDLDGREYYQVEGYQYWDGGRGTGDPVFYPVDQVAHWSPIPDPLNRWRGMSWLTPVVREINADAAMTQHRRRFFDNAGIPGLMIRYSQRVGAEQLAKVKASFDAVFQGPDMGGKTLVVDEGADVTAVGSTFEQMTFVDVQAAGENRIAVAAGVPPQVIGLKEGLSASTYSNYEQALRAFAHGTVAHLWASACASLAKLVTVPDGARLWYDTGDIAALQDAETARAEAAHIYAQAASVLITAGYVPESVQRALIAGDMNLLTHSGLVSVQLQQPGAVPAVGGSA